MTRKIKFRFWDLEEKKMVNGFGRSQLVIRLSGKVTEGATALSGVLMQFTGLKDKNGKEIYEWDILKGREIVAKSNGKFCTINPTEYYEVVFNKGQFAVKNIQSPHSTELPIYHFMFEDWMDVELVGNKFENPELLKND